MMASAKGIHHHRQQTGSAIPAVAHGAVWRGRGWLRCTGLVLLGVALLLAHAVAATHAVAAQDAPAAASRTETVDAAARHARRTAGGNDALRRRLAPKLPPDVRRDDQKYCYQIADDARDARYARQKKQLQRMQQQLEELLRKLQEQRAEHQRWVKRREAITRRMTAAILDVYARMEPEAAAAQIAQMEYAVAIAILTGLKPQQASAILTEMSPKQAGRLVNVIVGAVAESAVRGRRTREMN